MGDARQTPLLSPESFGDAEVRRNTAKAAVEASPESKTHNICLTSITSDQGSIHYERQGDGNGHHPFYILPLGSQNKVEGSANPSKRAWNPFWLRWYVLLLLGLACVCSVVAVAILYYFSQKNQGLLTASNAHKYAWKYGPTAFLTILAVFWQQVDYSCRSLEPWRNLARGYSAETETLLLDYVSAGLPFVIFGALKKKHWAVAASSTGSIALIIATAFSTGLLSLTSIPFTETDVTIPLSTNFSAEFYDGSFLQIAPRSWYGTNILGIPYEPGVRPDNSYQALDLTADWLRNSTVTAEVNAFVPNYNCEAVELQDISLYKKPEVTYFGINITEGWIKYNVRSKDCLVKQEYRLSPDPSANEVPQRLLQADITNINESCAMSSNRENAPDGLLTDSTVRLITLFDLRFQQLIEPTVNETALGGANVNVTGWSGIAAAVSSIICRPTYGIFSATVKVAGSPKSRDVFSVQVKDEVADHMPEFSYRNLSDAFEGPLLSLLQSTLPPLPTIQGTNQSIIGSFWQLMALANGGSTLEPFLDTSLTQATANRMFQGVMSEFANQQLTVPSDATTTGTRMYYEDRLQMKLLSSLVVGVVLVLLVVCLGVISILKARDVVPRDPASIATIATLLTTNPWAGDFFKNQGHASDN